MNRRGIALPIVLGLVLCLGVWVGSLSYTMSQSRNRFQQTIKVRRAYFLARSALQHFFLKVKIFQRQCPRAMQTLYEANPDKWRILSKAFIDDVAIPPEGSGLHGGKYAISGFTIEGMDREAAQFAVKITASGNVDGYGETISRIYKVSR